MRIEPAPLEGAATIELDLRGDERGFFARMYCEKEFAAAGLETRFVQANNSSNAQRGTLRGLHYQLPPDTEVKLVRCIRGALWDVIVDVRPGSPSFGRWFGAELTAQNRRMMYVPRGFAHGFITLTDDSELIYFVSDFYEPKQERGLRWNDPKIAIDWPIAPSVISEKDANWPDFESDWHGVEAFRK
ncbi:MAG: dTDP-4-dehydrorhamnose 3,5-epimerase [Gammaproteobacteria bacterium]|nr:dTDP-4-dehydrorhamnose 3,5-epimerase [Gammaproteobacteria bacterium]